MTKWIEHRMIDVREGDIQVIVDRSGTVWVNVDEVCLFRSIAPKSLVIENDNLIPDKAVWILKKGAPRT